MGSGVSDLTVFGEQVERLRKALPKERRPGKAELAAKVGISRSRWHRIMTGRAKLTADEALRLTKILETDVYTLIAHDVPLQQWEPEPDVPNDDGITPEGAQLEDYLSNFDRIVRTLRNFPGGKLGQRLKIGYLNGVEDAARETGNKLPLEFFTLRKRVLDGDL